MGPYSDWLRQDVFPLEDVQVAVVDHVDAVVRGDRSPTNGAPPVMVL
jgi:hypothetical protein